jgi:PhnB protein
MARSAKPVPDGYHTVTPYLIVEDAPAVLSFAERAFDAQVLHRSLSDDGRIVHAELQVGDSRIMLGEANEEWPAMRAMLHLYIEDVDTVYHRAVEAGGRPLREPQDMFYGDRSGGVEDPSGNQWWLATHVEDVDPEEMARRQAAAREADAGSDG